MDNAPRKTLINIGFFLGAFVLHGILFNLIGVTLPQALVQTLDGLSKGAAYALIALGLTLIFGTLVL